MSLLLPCFLSTPRGAFGCGVCGALAGDGVELERPERACKSSIGDSGTAVAAAVAVLAFTEGDGGTKSTGARSVCAAGEGGTPPKR